MRVMQYSFQQIEALHKQYAPCELVYRLVFEHCQIVRDIALQLLKASNLELDQELVVTGALLHNIGVYPLFGTDGKLRDGVNYITHGIEGERILQQEGYPEYLCRFAAYHTGVGLTKQDVTNLQLPLPPRDYLAQSDEEQLIMYADKFHSKTTPPTFNSFDWYRQDVAKFGQDKTIKFDALAAKFGKPNLTTISRQYGQGIR
jgi:uncharacterized protein